MKYKSGQVIEIHRLYLHAKYDPLIVYILSAEETTDTWHPSGWNYDENFLGICHTLLWPDNTTTFAYLNNTGYQYTINIIHEDYDEMQFKLVYGVVNIIG